jgi:hypothetical protein
MIGIVIRRGVLVPLTIAYGCKSQRSLSGRVELEMEPIPSGVVALNNLPLPYTIPADDQGAQLHGTRPQK